MSRLAEILLHIGLWTIFIIASFIGVITSKSMESLPYVWLNLLGLLYSVPLFYLFYSILIPQFLAQKKTGRFVFFSIITLFISGIIIWLIDNPLREIAGLETWSEVWWKEFAGGVLSSFYVTLIAIIIRFVVDWFRSQQIRLELINKNQASELALMKSQINPHFLFNTLNNIYSLVNRHDDKALDAMVKLSGIMRYLIYDTQSDLVLLEKEIEYLENYLELQRLRLRNPNSVEYRREGVTDDLKIAPMLLIPFVENAFKHGDKKVKAPNILIELQVDSNKLFFKVSNSIPDRVIEKDQTEGVGLRNLKKRLEILYQKKHDLRIVDEDRVYLAYLELQLS